MIKCNLDIWLKCGGWPFTQHLQYYRESIMILLLFKFLLKFKGFCPQNVVRLRYRAIKLVLVPLFQWVQTTRSTVINQNIAAGIAPSSIDLNQNVMERLYSSNTLTHFGGNGDWLYEYSYGISFMKENPVIFFNTTKLVVTILETRYSKSSKQSCLTNI